MIREFLPSARAGPLRALLPVLLRIRPRRPRDESEYSRGCTGADGIAKRVAIIAKGVQQATQAACGYHTAA